MTASPPTAGVEQSHERLETLPRHVPTLLCTNELFLQHAAVCMASLVENNPGLFFDFVIGFQPTENLDADRLRRSLSRFANHSLTFRRFAIPSDIILPVMPGTHYTLETYLRLWVEEFFPPDVERVLYLDSDMVVVGDIAPMWNVDLDGALMGAVDIPGSDRGVTLLRMRPEDGYFNAGMLLIDLRQWRAIDAGKMVIAYIQQHPERVEYDQDALNACFCHCTKRLDYKWNVIRPFYREPIPLPLARAEIEQIRRDAVIIHFNGGSKPWSYFCDHPARSEYHKYLLLTDWRDYVPPDRTPLNMVRKAVSVVLPAPIRRLLKAMVPRRFA